MSSWIDLSKSQFSGEPLTELENAMVREMLQSYNRSRWVQGKLWMLFVFGLGIPAAIAGFGTGISKIMAWFR
jgi:hypothetical protein